MELADVLKHIPSLREATAISQVHKGFSFDGKYFVCEGNGNDRPAYVLRTAPLKQTERKRREFEVVRRVYELGVTTSKPVEFGTADTLDMCYMVLSYVDGQDASEILPSLTTDEQYRAGIEAGRELRLMHEIDAPAALEPWHMRRTAKHYRQLADYRSCGVRLPEEEAILAFIDDNLALMQDRPNRFQHDDFHPSNLLIHNRRYAGVIDYNRYDWGDPYHEFLKLAYFGRDVSIPYCRGQIDGYFDGPIPELFWKLNALYTAMITLPTITWTLQVVPDNLESMLERIRVVLRDHRNFESAVPQWYYKS